MWNQFSHDSCLPDPGYPCSLDGYPAYVVNASTPELVKLGIDFAREHKIRLIVKNTGHDYLGRSIAPAALSLWTHHLRGIRTHAADNFTLAGSTSPIQGHAVTVAAGEQMYDIYRALDAVNRTIVGGNGKTVGIGGFITGGGHSLLAPRYGLAADNVLQMEMVTPGGEIITINENQHADLFWAMRGGGGSTFGVLTSVTFKTYPTPSILHMDLLAIADPSSPTIHDIIAHILSSFPQLSDAGLSAYLFVQPRLPNPFGSAATATAPSSFVSGILGYLILQDATNPQDIVRLWTPVAESIHRRWPNQSYIYQSVKSYPRWLDWYEANYDKGVPGDGYYLTSRLLDRPALTGNLTALRDAVRIPSELSGSLSTFLVGGKGVHDAKPPGGNAVLPAWRSAYGHFISALTFPSHNASAKAGTITKLHDMMEPLRRLAPNTGAYLNEASPFEPDWKQAFWGENYPRLLAIKRVVDPDDVFWCTPCVGNDRWTEVDGKLCKV